MCLLYIICINVQIMSHVPEALSIRSGVSELSGVDVCPKVKTR